MNSLVILELLYAGWFLFIYSSRVEGLDDGNISALKGSITLVFVLLFFFEVQKELLLSIMNFRPSDFNSSHWKCAHLNFNHHISVLCYSVIF